MASPFNNIVKTSFGIVKKIAGEVSTVSRSFEDVIIEIPIKVVLGETRVEEAIEGENIVVSSRIRDLLVDAADYVFDSDVGAVEPEDGDLFTVSINGVDTKYQVTPIAGERGFRTHTMMKDQWRIHCREVGQ